MDLLICPKTESSKVLEQQSELFQLENRQIASLCSELPSCYLRCTPAVEEEDDDVMHSIHEVHLTFKGGPRQLSSLPFLLSGVKPLVILMYFQREVRKNRGSARTGY